MNIVISEDSVAEVDLDSCVGNASIIRRGRYEAAPRSFLVGAQMLKQTSRDGAIVNVDVQFGNIDENLIP